MDDGQHKIPARTVPVNRPIARILAALAAAAVIGGLVYAVPAAAHLSEPAAATVHGPTARRLWAAAAAGLALVGAAIGGLALVRPVSQSGTAAVVALVAGLIAAVNGALTLAVAEGGPGTGNGVVGGAAALVLGLIAMALGGLARARSRRGAGQFRPIPEPPPPTE